MKSIARRPLLLALLGCIVVLWSASHVAGQQRKPVTLTRFFTGSDGQSHAEKTEVKLRPYARRAGLDESELLKVAGAQFLRWPSGHVWDWHNPSQRQYVITVSGRGEVELAGGQKIVLTPGQIVLAEDVTGKGHVTRSTGSEDLVLLLIPLAAQ